MNAFSSVILRSSAALLVAGCVAFDVAASASAGPNRDPGAIAARTPEPPPPGVIGADDIAVAPTPPPPSGADDIAVVQPSGESVIGTITPQPNRAGRPEAFTGGNAPQAGRHGAADDFKGGPGCSINCITSGIAYARGVDAELVVHTDTPAMIWIIVWNDDGYHRQFISDHGQTSFSGFFDDLEADTFYYAMAVAEDGEGYSSHGYGDFTTLSRNVQVSFTSATIHDSPFGDDDFWMRLWVNGEWANDGSGGYDPEGSTLPLGIQIHSFDDVGQSLDLSVQLSQSDDDADLCEATGPLDGPYIGGLGCTEYAYATLYDDVNDLDDRPVGASSWTEHSLSRTLVLPGGNALPGGYGHPLNFSVDVTLNVTYD
jgi:hypothetical protein